jgi:hypothetical protein
LSFEHPRGKINREKILSAIVELGENASPKQIKAMLDRKAILTVEQICRSNNLFPLPIEKMNLIKKQMMTERAMFDGLKKLTMEGDVKNENGRYSLSEKIKSDIRFLPHRFGDNVLAKMMDMHYPTINTLEKNLNELIILFGSYVIYCFVEAARPVMDYSKEYSMNNIEKDKLASKWIQEVFSPLNIYNYFLAAIKNQPSDNTVQKTLKNNFKEVKKDNEFVFVNDEGVHNKSPPSTQHFAREHFLLLTSDFDYANYKKGKPLYELDEATIKRLSQAFKTIHPIIYKQLLDAKEDFFGKPKQRSLPQNKKQNMPPYFDDYEDE